MRNDAYECGIILLSLPVKAETPIGVPILGCVNDGPFGAHTTRHSIDTEKNTLHLTELKVIGYPSEITIHTSDPNSKSSNILSDGSLADILRPGHLAQKRSTGP